MIPNSRHSPLKMAHGVPEAPSPRGGGDITQADTGTHLEGHRPTRTRHAGGAGCPSPASPKPIPPVHDARFANLTVKQSARFPLCGPDAITVAISCAFQRVCRVPRNDDVNQVFLEARAPSSAVSGAPCPRAWAISGAPQTGRTGKQPGFQFLGILLLLRENITKFVRPRARFNS
jgi:hypothetical protein